MTRADGEEVADRVFVVDGFDGLRDDARARHLHKLENRGPTHSGPRAAGPDPTPQLQVELQVPVNSLAPAAALGT